MSNKFKKGDLVRWANNDMLFGVIESSTIRFGGLAYNVTFLTNTHRNPDISGRTLGPYYQNQLVKVD